MSRKSRKIKNRKTKCGWNTWTLFEKFIFVAGHVCCTVEANPGLVGSNSPVQFADANPNALTPYTPLSNNNTQLMEYLMSTAAPIIDKNNGGAHIPSSFHITPNYWEWVCENEERKGVNCSDLDPHGPGYALQTERIDGTYGANIYDAATWALAAAQTNVTKAFNQAWYLFFGRTADGNENSTLHATSDPKQPPSKTFTYGINNTYITDPNKAYFFRMNAATFWNPDPLAGKMGIPKDAGQEWLDWKPITGENAWARLIMTSQLAYKKYGLNAPLNDKAMLLAHNGLTAFNAMQSPLGGVYYTTTDVSANQGNEKVNPHQVSLENNFSLLAGLDLFKQMLVPHIGEKFPDGTPVQDDIDTIDGIVTGILKFVKDDAFDKEHGIFYQGGLANDPSQKQAWVPTRNPFAVDVQTWGISVLGAKTFDQWFGEGAAYKAWQYTKDQAGYFGEKGKDPIQGVGYSNQPKPVTTPTIAVSVKNEDGDSRQQHPINVFALWKDGSKPTQLTKEAIPYNQTANVTVPMSSATKSPLKMLQFLDDHYVQVATVDGKAINEEAKIDVSWQDAQVKITQYAPNHEILSAEWTFGAINLLEMMQNYYESVGQQAIADDLAKDIKSMTEGVKQLRSDRYQKDNPHIPQSAMVKVPAGQVADEYANKRYLIPFGWDANVVPSTCSVAWDYLQSIRFNPFQLGGKQQATDWIREYLKQSLGLTFSF